ncbi:MAG: sodium:panthothenate symporter [Opitutaceae bacterium]|jgi:Na+/proline symporter|nr:sodium:panthothenate symporter [Opitutaceae bacterium]
MHLIDWLIVIIPVLFILGLSIYAKRYVRGVVDFLAAGRVAGRYVISVGDMAAVLGVITIVALVEQKYQVGYALTFWEFLVVPVGIIIGLTGYCTYRFRETRALSIGQFLEMRYNRPFRIVAASLRTLSEMLTNAIGPAVAANFFIYFLGLPHTVTIAGVNLPTFAILVFVVLCLCMVVIWPGGRISLLISDSVQGLLCYPIFVIIAGYIFLHFNWGDTIAPVMLDRVPGESFLDPFDIDQLRDFNLFALVVTIVSQILNRASWIGNDTSGAGRSPHEQKMAGILGQWRNGFSGLTCLLLAVMLITLMTHRHFADQAHEIRRDLTRQVAGESVADPAQRAALEARIAALPVQRHQIGEDPPLSSAQNLDTPYFETVRETLGATPQANLEFQKFRTLYNQMMLPVALNHLLPVGLMGLFCLLMIMLMLSTDDSRVFNAASTIIQDVVLPLRKTPLTPAQHLRWLRLCSVAVCVFFFVVSLFFVQLDYINMFLTIMTAMWMGGAGPIMIFGLYSRFGTTTGAFCSLIFGSGISIGGLFVQRNWADWLYPWLHARGWADPLGRLLETASAPLHPYVVWKMDAVKFPINSYELYFIAMISGIVAYVLGSLLSYRQPYNLDRLLHRGVYDLEGRRHAKTPWTLRSMWGKLVGITPEYTRGDKIIAWSVVVYAIIYQFGFCFVGVLVWNLVSPWPDHWWSTYFFITSLVVTGIIGIVSTFWFMIGGVIDIRRLFRDLAARVDDPLDNGMVEGQVSLSDKARFHARETPPPAP